ncbi:MAG: nucleotidyl transferase AbiEii/AbiGii toxin family protein [Acidobacteriota bacterium]
MSVKPVFEKLRTALESAGIPYFVTGSFASSAHGIPRSTNDIDIVIAPSRDQLSALLAQFPESEFAASSEAAFEAMSHGSQFNIIDFATLWKVDFIFRQSTPFDASRFARREIVDIAGVRLQTASAEDILVTKLWWAKLGESERQINDAAGIIQVQGETLNVEYVARWVVALQLDTQWQAARERAG